MALWRNRNKWSVKQQADFLNKLSTLLQRGYSIANALMLLMHYQKPHIKKGIQEGVESLKNGYPFHLVLQNKGFSSYITSYLYSSEKQGNLIVAIENGAKWLDARLLYEQRLQKMLRYPLLLLVLLVGMVYFMQILLFPQFSMLYGSVGHELPLLTRFVSFLPTIIKWMMITIIIIVFICFLLYRFYLYPRPLLQQLSFFMNFPFVRRFLSLFLTHQYMLQLGSLLNGGLSIYDSLEVLLKQTYAKFVQEVSLELKGSLEQGLSLATALEHMPYFESESSIVLLHGQANGTVAKEMLDYSEIVFEQLETYANNVLRIVQPLLFLTIGVTVIMIYLGMMLPIFDLMQTI
ncbi:competence type IV pilus assembly protein ComGB [Bacillus solimangrovi]|uniref:Type II secretion system protein GspF domain-containing protein n=1 Tax=Bacillus solimangrovi TaxID=1305675 RepID=A0A1E5LFQ6_9BACI|nr:competence type IV pilus assembly protein ComGB [Bacillus solimangrovi]OEH92886.1 hypothetical protein BFG57_14510 [Bacillus solimangrovi]